MPDFDVQPLKILIEKLEEVAAGLVALAPNLLAAVILLALTWLVARIVRQPMRIGDYTECEGVTGEVKQISIRETYLRRTDGVLVMLPNALLYKNPVRVLTDWEKRRQSLIVGVAYDEDVAQSRSVIEEAMVGLDSIDGDRPLQVFAKAFSSSSIDFEVRWWSGSTPFDVRESRDQVIEAIKTALDRAGIEIPFPYRTLTLKEPLTVRREDDATRDSAEAEPARVAG